MADEESSLSSSDQDTGCDQVKVRAVADSSSATTEEMSSEASSEDKRDELVGKQASKSNLPACHSQSDEADSTQGSGSCAEENEDSLKNNSTHRDGSDRHDYEIIDGQYYYTDTSSGHRYKYDTGAGKWISTDAEVESKNEQQVTTDEQGRTYYYANDMYLCRDPHGNVFYWDKNSEWKPWTDKSSESGSKDTRRNDSKWYFYQGNDTFYRDGETNIVYKFNKEKNEWEKYEGKLRKKRPRIDEEEEFDTSSDEGSDEDFGNGLAPPGAANDPNIYYDGQTYTKHDPGDNMVYEWDVNRRAWFPKLDDDFMATYQLSYGFNPDGTKNENPLKFDDDEEEEEERRRKAEEAEKKAAAEKAKQGKKKPSWFQMDEALNTKVYVSNLPDETTEEEFIDLMQKCGMILKDVEKNRYKIKMYRDAEGNFKGDALCTYIKTESVDLALQILDDYQFGNRKIKVEPAKFEQKGEYDPSLKPKKKKKKELEKIQKKQQKLFDWRPEPMRGQREKHENTVVIRNCFDPKEFETAVEKMLTHKEAMRNQCINFGHIKKIELYDRHPEGVVQVTFQEVEAADMCIATLNNRLYLSRTLKVACWDGKEKFKIEETEAEREERLKNWNKYLEGGKEATV